MKTSNILLAGAIMSYLKIEPWADYVLVAGALVVIARGAVRTRERNEDKNDEKQ